MTVLRSILLCLAVSFSGLTSPAQNTTAQAEPLPTADAIMARVAANQDQAQAERGHYVYIQHEKVVSRKGKTVMCEEVTDSRITPTEGGSHAELLKLDGRLLSKHKYVSYTKLLAKGGEAKVDNDHNSVDIEIDDTDRDLVENMRSGLMNDKSKDGINAQLFPLTSKEQADYRFRLVGRERMNDRDVFHIVFRPKDKNDFGWKGDAYIDAAAYQPVVVSTDMSRKIPLAVRALLGTDLPGLGFTVVYAPQPDGVWFPVSFGTEFKIHVLFFFTRDMIIDAHNLNFEKTHVSSKIVASGDPVRPN
jgi:hypothetical protein